MQEISVVRVNDIIAGVTLGVTLIGIVLSVWGIHDAAKDRMILGNGVRRILLNGHIRDEIFHLLVQVMLFMTVTLTVALPEVPPGAMPEEVLTFLAVRKFLLFLISFVIMLGVLMQRSDRYRVLHYGDQA